MAYPRAALLRTLALGGAMAVVITLAHHWLQQPLGPVPFLLLGFFVALHLAGTFLGRPDATGQQAVRGAMTGMAVKMFACMIVLALLVLLAPREQVLAWTMTFAGLYLVFLVFGTVEQYSELRRRRTHGTP